MSDSEQSDTPLPRSGSVLLKAKHLETVLSFHDSSKAHNPNLRSRTASTLPHVASNRKPPPVLPKPRLDKHGKAGLTESCIDITGTSPTRADGLPQCPPKTPMKPSKSSIACSSSQAEVTEPLSGNVLLASDKLQSDKEGLQRNSHSKSQTRISASFQSPPKLPPKPTISRFHAKENRTDVKLSSQTKSAGDWKSRARVAGEEIRKLFHKIKPRDLMRSLLRTTQEENGQENLDVEDDLPLPKVFADDIKGSKNFTATVVLILERLQKFNESVKFEDDPTKLRKIHLDLQEKKILISAFGCHNAGKSTLLNALLGNSLLPVSQMNETSVTVEIQHDENVHWGPCTASDAPCKNCPFLKTRSSSTEDTSRSVPSIRSGVEGIYNTLGSINKDVRATKEVGAGTEYTIHTNVPMIQAPPSWTIHLVDNAGFGEAGQEGIIEQATTALKTSSAYIYIMSYENLGDSKDVAAFQKICDKDKDVFKDRRLLVVVTHFDVSYTNLMEDQVLSQDEVREEVCNVVKTAKQDTVSLATEDTVSLAKDDVVLVSGKWANTARKLLYVCNDGQLKRKAENYLKTFRKRSNTAISTQDLAISTKDLARQLEEASGITSVEKWVKEMASACLGNWVQNIKRRCSDYLTKACDTFASTCRSLEAFNNANITVEYATLKSKHEKLEAAQKELLQVKSGKDSGVYKELEKAYQKDIHEQSLLAEVLQTADDAIQEFSTSCKEKCGTNYKPAEFSSDVDKFLEDSSKDLVKKLSNFNFESVSSCFATQRKDMGEKAVRLMDAAATFCATDRSVDLTPQSPSQGKLSDVFKKEEIPKCLKDLNIKLPTLSGFEKVKRWLSKLFLGRSAGLREDEIDETMEKLRTELENGCRNFLKKVQPDVLEFYYGQCKVRVENVLEIFNRKYGPRVGQQQQAMKKLLEEEMKNQEEIDTMQQWQAYLDKLHNQLYRSAREFLDTNKNAIQDHVNHDRESSFNTVAMDDTKVHSDPASLTVYFHQHKTEEHKQTTTEETGETVNGPSDNRQTGSRPLPETAGAVLYPEITDEILPGETVDGPNDNGRLQSRAWSDVTDAVFYPKMGHTTLPGEIAERVSDARKAQSRPFSETDAVSYSDKSLPGESPQHMQTKSKERNSSRRRKPKSNGKKSGLRINWWSRSQEGSSPVPTSEAISQKVPNFEDDFKEDLLSICEAVKNRLEQLQTELQGNHVLNLVTAELVHLWKQAEERQILIAVLGHYNSGKSSLLNALVGDKILPVSITHETEMKVKLQYDVELHPGCCEKSSFDELSPSFCKSCPVLFEGEGVEVCKGACAIVSQLQQIHRTLRQDPGKNAEEYTIHVNIPILSCVPTPWQLCLVDNPSFKELTGMGMKEELQDEVMALSAYIYTAPYKQLIDAVDANAFKLISEKDQAKAAFLEERLVIAVTHFDTYYAGLEKNEKANVEQVKELVCMTIKKTTSREFPLASVVPVCSQWALIAKQLSCQPQNESLLQKALKCLQLCPGEYTEGDSDGAVHPVVVARQLEAASGIKQLEVRIMELAQKAFDESKYRITNVFLGYLKVASKNLSRIIDEPEETDTATGKPRDTLFASHQMKINFLRRKLETYTKREGYCLEYQSLHSQCSAEVEDLLRKMEEECKGLVQNFQENCATKIANGEQAIFGSAELEKDIDEFQKNACNCLQSQLSSATFPKSIKVLYDSIDEVDKLFTEILQLTHLLHNATENMPQTAGKHLDVEPWLCAVKKLPLLQPDKLKKEVDIPRSGGLFGLKPKSYTREDQLHKVMNQLESFLLQWLKTSLRDLQDSILKLLFGHLCNYAKEGLKTFTDKFGDTPMESDETEKLQGLHSWQKHLQDLQKHLKKKSEEDLAAREELLTSYSSP